MPPSELKCETPVPASGPAAGRQEAHLCLWAARLCPSRWNSPESVLGPSLAFLGESSAFRPHGKTSVGRGRPHNSAPPAPACPISQGQEPGGIPPLVPWVTPPGPPALAGPPLAEPTGKGDGAAGALYCLPTHHGQEVSPIRAADQGADVSDQVRVPTVLTAPQGEDPAKVTSQQTVPRRTSQPGQERPGGRAQNVPVPSCGPGRCHK